jgi:hypothetical protein
MLRYWPRSLKHGLTNDPGVTSVSIVSKPRTSGTYRTSASLRLQADRYYYHVMKEYSEKCESRIFLTRLGVDSGIEHFQNE